jgi:hypothetical protein
MAVTEKPLSAQEASQPMRPSDFVPPHDRGLAAFLAWLFPGAGHFYQRRHAKGIIFLVCIFGTFLYGMLITEGRAVYARWHPRSERHLSYLCQLGVGLPSLPALVTATWERPFLNTSWYWPPTAAELDDLHKRMGFRYELGKVFTMIAGLLNVLAIYDAWGGPAYGNTWPSRRKRPAAEDPAASAA